MPKDSKFEFEIFNYKISPYSGNTCWKIQERQDKDGAKAEWREPYYYPSTFEHACIKVRELARMDKSLKTKDVDKLLKELKAMDEEFISVVKSFPIQRASDLA